MTKAGAKIGGRCKLRRDRFKSARLRSDVEPKTLLEDADVSILDLRGRRQGPKVLALQIGKYTPLSLLPLMADRPDVGGNRFEVGLRQGLSSHRRHCARILLGLRHAARYRFCDAL